MNHYINNCDCLLCVDPKNRLQNELIKEVSQELEKEDDLEDGCFIDYSDLEKHNEYQEPTGLIDFSPRKKESKGLKVNLKIRKFPTGATRDTSEGKLEYARFMSPIVIKRYAEYMNLHRKQSDGNLRDPDNWQNLFGDKHEDVCMDSLWRHLMDLWLINKGFKNEAREDLESALCAILFNTQAWLFKILKEKCGGSKS